MKHDSIKGCQQILMDFRAQGYTKGIILQRKSLVIQLDAKSH